MTVPYKISDELLNAYMDSELGPEDKARVHRALEEDPGLREYYCRLRRVRECIRDAYPRVTTERKARSGERVGHWRRGAVAAALVALGATGGWAGHALTLLHGGGSGEETVLSRVVHPPQNEAGEQARMMLHVTTDDPREIGEALGEVDALLREYSRANTDFRLRVVVNGDGLAMLRAGGSPHADWISKIRQEHDNVRFLACQNAIDRVEREEGLDVQLLPEADVVPVAMAEIIQRQREGWSYIKI